MVDSIYSRRQFLGRSAAAGAGLFAMQIAGAGTAVAVGNGVGAKSIHPLTKSHDPDVLLRWIQAVYDSVKLERLTPPNAARIYAYFGVAAYEAVVGGMPPYRSLGLQLNDLPKLPSRSQNLRYDWPTAANAAMAAVAPVLFAGRTASLAKMRDLESVVQSERNAAVKDGSTIDRSVGHGRSVGKIIAEWIQRDGWTHIQGLPAYVAPMGEGLWERTPPNFGLALEPYWEKVRPFALVPVTACAPPPPIAFSTDPGSAFYAQAMATYTTVKERTDSDAETALFWRDNPDGTTGLPSGHWALIASILIRQEGYDLARAAELMVMHGIAVADGFTSCWTEKYRTNLVRPVTYIKKHIDPDWNSPVNSPAFPEYTSGHSVGSGAAAAVLTSLVGAVSFTDDTGIGNGFAPRPYSSIWDAANEAAISRLFGGIHYPMGITAGIDQGVCVAQAVMQRIKTRK
ncbi:MAG: vanadium-dependent haloperoxidase [Acidimicrobiia bacterium]|nr:vanadium-dependent haloperoxidase [Acidimicrobiia bacterium]NNL27394.1 vanadium-dependent haloperoxidase [Acidimicrobiia bacterium]